MKENVGYKNLAVWKKSVELVVAVYKLTGGFPETERFGLVSQMRRAAVSIPSNITEGSRRKSKKEFSHFLSIAFGSGAELETQTEIVKRLSFGKQTDHLACGDLLLEVMKMLNKMVNYEPRATIDYGLQSTD